MTLQRPGRSIRQRGHAWNSCSLPQNGRAKGNGIPKGIVVRAGMVQEAVLCFRDVSNALRLTASGRNSRLAEVERLPPDCRNRLHVLFVRLSGTNSRK